MTLSPSELTSSAENQISTTRFSVIDLIFIASDQADFIAGETGYVRGGPRVSNRED